MIYLTGDTHGSIDFDKVIRLNRSEDINENDFLIVTGDFGWIWSRAELYKNIAYLDSFKFKILFIDGNHENFDILEKYPLEKWSGGLIHRISMNLYHLTRGEIYTIEDKKILTIGGAESIDKEYRYPNISWWEQESITEKDIENALINLEKNKYSVDYVITHTCAEIFIPNNRLLDCSHICKNKSETLLNRIANICKYNKWIFGHWHIDANLNDKVRAIYQDIIRLE